MTPIVNAMTVDVEDYFQVEAFARTIPRDAWDSFPRRVEANTDRILEQFAQARVTATFFTLGWVAERHPALIRRIVQIAIVYLSTRAGGVLPDPKGLRAKAAEAAEKYMSDVVAAGKIAIETPTTPSSAAVTNKPAGPSMTAKTLYLQKADQEGA